MLIRMKTLACGPDFHAEPGDIVDRDDAEARAMIDGGHADLVDEQLVDALVKSAKSPAARRTRATAAKRETR